MSVKWAPGDITGQFNSWGNLHTMMVPIILIVGVNPLNPDHQPLDICRNWCGLGNQAAALKINCNIWETLAEMNNLWSFSRIILIEIKSEILFLLSSKF